MADRFLNSGDGSDSNGGTSWSDEKLTIATGIAAIDAAGDRVLIDSGHAESAATISYTCPGTPASPMQVLSVTPSGGSGVSALTAGATFTSSSGAGGVTFAGSGYFYGLSLVNSSTSAGAPISAGNGSSNVQTWEDCSFSLTGTASGGYISFGGTNVTAGNRVTVKNPTFRFGATSQRVLYAGDVHILGGQWSGSGTLNPTDVFESFAGSLAANRCGNLTVTGFDFSNLNAAINLHGDGQAGARAVFRKCKLPASWSGAPISDANTTQGTRIEMYNCDSADTNYRLWIKDYAGSIVTETTYYRTGGASDGTTSYSFKMTTTANVGWPASSLYSQDLVIWNDTTGSSVTVTCEIEHAGVGGGAGGRLTDREAWLEVVGLATSGYPLGTVYDDACADVITGATDQDDSSESWAGSLGSAVKQKLAVTFTPQEKGWILCRVHLAKPSATIYFDPELALT